MSNRIKWTDRQFDFTFPAALYPEIIERLRGTPPRLEEHCRSTHALTYRDNGRWSIQENAGHLLDLESLVQQRIEEYVSNSQELHAADLSNRRTYEASHNSNSIELILADFRKQRTTTVDRLETLNDGVFERVALHPRLNIRMRLVDMLFFQAEHDDYHLTRISELRRYFDQQGTKQ